MSVLLGINLIFGFFIFSLGSFYYTPSFLLDKRFQLPFYVLSILFFILGLPGVFLSTVSPLILFRVVTILFMFVFGCMLLFGDDVSRNFLWT